MSSAAVKAARRPAKVKKTLLVVQLLGLSYIRGVPGESRLESAACKIAAAARKSVVKLARASVRPP